MAEKEKASELNEKLNKSKSETIKRLNVAKIQLHEARLEAEKFNKKLIDAGFHHQIVDCW